MKKESRNMFVIDGDVPTNSFKKVEPNNAIDKLFHQQKVNNTTRSDIEIEIALRIIVTQMKNSGNRERTISDYVKYTLDFANKTDCVYVSEITLGKIYEWFETMTVANSTKKIRFKSLSAVLGRFYDNGWLTQKFWKSIKIKVDEQIKQPAKWEDVELILSILDFNNFFQLRDACAILLMWQTGIRIRTLSLLEEKNIDFNSKVLLLDGEIMDFLSYRYLMSSWIIQSFDFSK